MTSNVPLRVVATTKALDLIKTLQDEHGDVLFHQSGGCCDGSSPMCYAVGEYMISDDDVKLGVVGGAGFYMSPSQFEYWRHTHLTLDVVPGRGGMFSLENGREVRFHIRSRIFSDDEVRALEQAAA
jgi:uncharacterized protein (DUF779 family)